MASIITLIASKTVANETVHVDQSSNGLGFLHLALKELEQRLSNTKSEALCAEAALMRASIGSILEQAYSDFQAFAQRWECSVHFWDHPQKSNNFTFFLREKNSCPKSYHFRFAGLRGALI